MYEVEFYENWYALFVMTGKEIYVKNSLYKRLKEDIIDKNNLVFVVPELESNIKRNRVWQIERSVLFPGYVLIGGDIDKNIYNRIKKVPNVFRFIKAGSDLCKISHKEMNSIGEWFNEDALVENSIIDLDINDNVIVIDGPLKGHEGNIIKFNKHKRRVTVKIDFFGRSTETELSFEFVNKNRLECDR